MSKLSKLIKELCPEGVEYRPLGEIGSFERGRRFVKADAVESDGIPCVHYGELYTHYGLWANVHKSQIRSDIQTKLRYAEKNDVIIVGAGENNIDIGIAVAWLGDYKVAVHDACYIFKHQQDPKYISYLLRTNSYHQQIKKFVSEGKICSISAENLAKAVLPFPPVPIQQEIVRILDRYTELKEQLESELKAELEARKLQYEYYRNQLLNFAPPRNENVKWVKLGDAIISLKTGLNPRKNFVLNEEGSNKPYITGKDIYNNKINVTDRTDMINDKTIMLINKRACLESGLLLFASTGTGTVGRMAVIEKYNNDWAMSETLYAIKTDEGLLPKFLMHCLYSDNLRSQFEPKISKGSVPHLKVVDLLNVIIPIPSIDEQQKIVSIIDRFESLSINLQSDIPAEITARRIQYEYYREKLLTFKRKAA